MISPRFSNLSDWLAWQETAHPSAIDLGIERVKQVAVRLDVDLNGQLFRPPAKRVTIAGTNGKGSCVASLTALLQAQNKRVGSYTSPHVLRYNERIQIGGEPVSDQALCEAFAAIDTARGDISLTYFEFGTLAAFWLLARAPLDVWLIEVGLGGRLDATNILDPDIAVITSIDLDHQAWLGNTREAIGYEKAGICRSQAPLVCSDPNPPQSIRQAVQQLGCKAYWLGQDFGIDSASETVQFQLSSEWHVDLPVEQVHLPVFSIAAALKVCELLSLLPTPAAAAHILADARLIGRMNVLWIKGVEVILDVAHNPASMAYLAKCLAQRAPKPTEAVIGMMADKDIEGSLIPLLPCVTRFHCASIANVARAASAAQLQHQLHTAKVSAYAYESVAAALDAALPRLQTTLGRLVICGSFYTISDAFTHLTALGATTNG